MLGLPQVRYCNKNKVVGGTHANSGASCCFWPLVSPNMHAIKHQSVPPFYRLWKNQGWKYMVPYVPYMVP